MEVGGISGRWAGFGSKWGLRAKLEGVQDPRAGSRNRLVDYQARVDRIETWTPDLDEVFGRLARSSFRRRFRLRAAEKDYLERRGLDTVMSHGEKFIEERLAPADPPNDGKQTPMRNHPIFIAQHATATCCRGCLEKWHSNPQRTCADRRGEGLHPGGPSSLAYLPGRRLKPNCEPSVITASRIGDAASSGLSSEERA